MPASSLPKIFDYLDCVKYVRDYYEARHTADRWFSYRYIQSKTRIDPGYLFKIFQGKKPLPQNKVGAIAKIFGLNKRESEYFNLLVLYTKADSNDEIRKYFERMLSFKEVVSRKVDIRQYKYYTKWYYAALRQILSYYPFRGDYKALARMTVPAISTAEAKRAVTLLCDLGFVEKTSDGTFRPKDQFITTGEEWSSIAVMRFQQETIMLAHQALDTVDKDLRDISTVSVALSPEGFSEAKERIRQFRKDMLELANRQEKPDAVYHMNIQMVPIGRRLEGADE